MPARSRVPEVRRPAGSAPFATVHARGARAVRASRVGPADATRPARARSHAPLPPAPATRRGTRLDHRPRRPRLSPAEHARCPRRGRPRHRVAAHPDGVDRRPAGHRPGQGGRRRAARPSRRLGRGGVAGTGHRGGGRPDRRGPGSTAGSPPGCWPARSATRPRRRAWSSFSDSIATGHREGLIADTHGRVRRPGTPPGSTRWSTRRATTASATSGCAPCTAATCCGTRSPAGSSRPRSTSCSGGLRAGRGRLSRRGGRGRRRCTG